MAPRRLSPDDPGAADEPRNAASGELIYGRHAVLEALGAGESVLEVRVAESAKPQGTLRDILNSARRAGVPVKWVPAQALDRQVATAGTHGRHQGVVAVVSGYRYADLAEMLAAALRAEEPPLLLVLEGVQDVHNVGTLLRTAEAVGVHGVVLAEREGAAITPAVRNASAGAVAHLRIGRTDVATALDEVRSRGLRVVGLAQQGEASLFATDLTGGLALVVGGEAKGLRPVIARRCDALAHLPMLGRVASLNAAVAGSVALYEALRQRAPEA